MEKAPDRKTILLVEDDDDDATLFEVAVDRSNCDVLVQRVGSTEEAIARVNAGLCPQLIFLDLLLPNLNGIHFLRWIRAQEHCKCIPVIAISGLAPTHAMSELCALGVNAVMVKPAAVAALEEAVGAACIFWLKYSIPPPSPK